MSKTRNYLQTKALENIPGPALDALGKGVLKAVDTAVDRRWDNARAFADEAEGDDVEQRVKSIIRRFKRELTVVGAATGAVAAAPVVGTAAAASALGADLAWFSMRATDLIMAIGAAYGHRESTIEERRAWVLAVLAFGDDAGAQFTTLLQSIDGSQIVAGDGIGGKVAGMFSGDAATMEALRRINTSLAAQVATKYGTRRSVLAIGKLLPFGIGAVVGGTANYSFVRIVGKQSKKFFAEAAVALPADQGPFVARPRHLSAVPTEDGAELEA